MLGSDIFKWNVFEVKSFDFCLLVNMLFYNNKKDDLYVVSVAIY